MKKMWKPLPYYDKITLNYIINPIKWSGTLKYDLQNKKLYEGIELCTVSAEGFKTACASLSFVMPLGEKASLYALVPNVLTRSCKDYPDVTSIEKKLALLYGAEVIVDVGKSGENQILKIEISCIDDRFSIDEESITNECLKLLFQMIFEPRLENGAFCPDDVESEKRLLEERLIAENSDKRTYAKNRCNEIMFENEVYEGIPELLEKIKKSGRKIVLATSKPEEFALRILEHFELIKYFDVVAGASMDEKRNKKGDVIRYAIEKGGFSTENAVMIGDREHDIFGAKENGLPSIGVLYGYGSREELEAAGADYIAETVDGISDLL